MKFTVTKDDLFGTNLSSLAEKRNVCWDDVTELDVQYCGLEMTDIAFISQWKNVTKLIINRNDIGVEGAKLLSKMSKLVYLDVGCCFLGPDGAKEISSMHTLQTLIICDNQIEAEGAKYISTMSNVTCLNIAKNKIYDDGAKAISTMLSLTRLCIGYNKLVTGTTCLSRLVNLTYLDVEMNNVDDDQMLAISTLEKVTSLNVSLNNIGEFGAFCLSGMKQLVTLNAVCIGLNKRGIRLVVENLPNLKELELEGDGNASVVSVYKRLLDDTNFRTTRNTRVIDIYNHVQQQLQLKDNNINTKYFGSTCEPHMMNLSNELYGFCLPSSPPSLCSIPLGACITFTGRDRITSFTKGIWK